MKQIFINFNFSIFDLNLTILDLVFLTMVVSMTLVIFHMSGIGRKIGEIGKKVVTGLVGVYANLNIGERVLGGKDESKSETSPNNSNDPRNQSSTNTSCNKREGTKNSTVFFFSIQKFISTTVQFFFT